MTRTVRGTRRTGRIGRWDWKRALGIKSTVEGALDAESVAGAPSSPPGEDVVPRSRGHVQTGGPPCGSEDDRYV